MSTTARFGRQVGLFLRTRHAFWVLPALSLLAWSCQVATSEKVENSLSFSRIAEDLKQYDEVLIVLKKLDGTPIDTLYREKVTQAEDVQKLPAPHWDGGRVMVAITGKKDGKVVYHVETRYTPATGTRDSISVFIVPEVELISTVRTITLLVGDSLNLRFVTVQPEILLDKTLDWKTDPESLVTLGHDFLLAKRAGTGVLTVSLRNNPDADLSLPFTISASGNAPENLSIEPESLEVAANGPTEQLTAKIDPSTASSAVDWKSADSNVATVDSNGRVQGKRPGETSILATSRVRSIVHASAYVKVTGPKPVTSVKFSRENLDILEGVGAESLMVSVLPIEADPEVVFTLTDSSRASVQQGKISGTKAGPLSVIASSVSNPSAKDTLIVLVSPPTVDDTLPPEEPKVRINSISPTPLRRPIWSWISGGGGSGNYQVSLDEPVIDSNATTVSETLYQPPIDLDLGVHVLYVRERDAAGNWSPPGSAQVEIDYQGPEVPKVIGTSPTNALPRWTWSSGGGGGASRFRSRLGDANFPATASGTADTVFTLASAVSGTTYTLYVQERDASENWSQSASHPIKYDLTKPTIKISVPQASGIFLTALDTATVSGSVDGLNGIAKLEYSVDAGPLSVILVGTGGSWSIPSLPVANAKTTAIKIMATDSLGNKSEAGLSIQRDSDLPSPPVALSNQVSPTNVATASWFWAAGNDGAAGSGLNGSYRWKLNAGAWAVVTVAAATGVALSEGANTFAVQEQDNAKNWSASVTSTVILDTKPPDPVSFTGTDSTEVATLTPTWTWSTSLTNGGTGVFVLKLDAGSEFDWTSKTYTPATSLGDNAMHTLIVKEKDQVSGVTGAAKSFTYSVKVGLDPTKAWGGLKNIAIKTSGCGKTTTVASGIQAITSSGQARSFIIDLPDGYDINRPYRLFYCSHYLGTSAETIRTQEYYRLRTLAAAANVPAIFIAPQSLSNGTWRTTSDSDHVLFDDILAYAKANLCIDSTRVFATGFSFGGMVTYALSTTRQKHIRAAVGMAPTNYNIWLPNPLPTTPIAWMQTTGMSDGTIPWISNSSTSRGAKFIAAQRGRDNGCTVPDPIPTWVSGGHLCYDFSGCAPEFPTKACTFSGGHTDINSDPGSTVNWISEESWKFFEQF